MLKLLRYEWEVFSSVRRFFMVATMLFMMEVLEMNGFFLKYVLWYGLQNLSRFCLNNDPLFRIPPQNPLNTIRLLLLWLLSIPGVYIPNNRFSSAEANLFSGKPSTSGTLMWLLSRKLRRGVWVRTCGFSLPSWGWR